MADATVRRRTGKAKQFFAEALERGLVDQNPFAKLPSHVKANTARQFFVPADWIERCIEVATHVTWRTILALARYGSLRCTPELLRLRWSDVNLPEGRMSIHASKTEHHGSGGMRQCPIFPELRPYLDAAWDAAQEGSAYVIDRYRGTGVNLRTRFESIIELAGLVPWPKLMQNLRASRETELMAKFPARMSPVGWVIPCRSRWPITRWRRRRVSGRRSRYQRRLPWRLHLSYSRRPLAAISRTGSKPKPNKKRP